MSGLNSVRTMRVTSLVALAVLLAGGVALAEGSAPICLYAEPGRFVHVAVDQTALDFLAFGDAYEGGENWKKSTLAERYERATNSGTEPLPPVQIYEQLIALLAAMDASPSFAGQASDNRATLRGAMRTRLEALARAVVMLEGKPLVSWDAFRDGGGSLATFSRTSMGAADGTECGSARFGTNSAFFAVPDPANATVLRLERWEPEGPLDLLAADPEQSIYIATLDQAIEYRAIVDQVQSLFAGQVGVAVNQAAMRLAEVNVGWKNYLEHGYSQYPWESFVNSWLPCFTWNSPPDWQLVLIHPEASAVVDARSTQGASLAGSLLVHGLGYVHYFGADRGWFVGASATASITTDSALGWGGGGTLHFGHSAIHETIPHISLSVLFHDTNTGSSGPFIGISADLWRLLDRGGAQGLYKNALAK